MPAELSRREACRYAEEGRAPEKDLHRQHDVKKGEEERDERKRREITRKRKMTDKGKSWEG